MDDKDLFAAPTEEELFAAPTEEEMGSDDLFAAPTEDELFVAPSAEELGEDPEKASKGEAFVGGLGQDVTFGFMDELKGAIEAGGRFAGIKGLGKEFGEQEFDTSSIGDLSKLLENYRAGRDFERERIQKLQDDQSGAFLAGEVTGMVAPALLSGGASLLGKAAVKGGAKVAGKQATKELLEEATEKGIKEFSEEGLEQVAKDFVKKDAKETLLKKVGKGALTGAGVGGLYATGLSDTDFIENPIELMEDASSGVASGALFGGIVPTAGHLAKKGIVSGFKKGSKAYNEIKKIITGAPSEKLVNLEKYKGKIIDLGDFPKLAELQQQNAQKLANSIPKLGKEAEQLLSKNKVHDKKTVIKFLEDALDSIETGIARGDIDPKGVIKGSEIGNARRILNEFLDRTIQRPDAVERSVQQALKKMKKQQAKVTSQFRAKGLPDPEFKLVKNTPGNITYSYEIPGKKTPSVLTSEVKIPEYQQTKFTGDKLSNQDLHHLKQQFGEKINQVFGKQEPSGAQLALKQVYGKLSDDVRQRVGQEKYGKLMDEISLRKDLLREEQRLFGLKTLGKVDDKGVYSKEVQFLNNETKKMEKALKEIAEGTDSQKSADARTVLEHMSKVRDKLGVEPGQMSMKEKAEIQDIYNTLTTDPKFSHLIRTVGSGLFMGVLGNYVDGLGPGTGILLGAAAGYKLPRMARKSLLKEYGKQAGKQVTKKVDKRTPFQQFLDKTKSGRPLSEQKVISRAVIDKNTVENKLEDREYLSGLIDQLDQSGESGQELYADQLRKYEESPNKEEKRRIQYNLTSQPGFRKLLKEYEDLKKQSK